METKRTGRQVEPAQPHHVDHPTAVNRTLAYIQTAGGDYSVLAAAAGAGRAYVFDPSHPPQRADEIAAAEASARKAGLGLWGPPCFGQTEAVPL